MKSRWIHWKRILSRALLLTIVLTLVIPPAPAQAWKSNAHVYLAEIARLDALDGTITLPRYDPDTGLHTGDELGPYPVDSKIRLALELCPQQYRAGALGPDAYPDVMTGQLLTHPNNQPESVSNISGATNTSQWINAIWAAVPLNLVPSTASTCTEELAKVAFATGYLTHTAGDMYGHTFINYFAGGAFNLKENALQHVIIEGYVDKLIPGDDIADFYDFSINGATSLIYDVLITRMPGKTLRGYITDNKANVLSIPRFMNGLRVIPAGLLSTMNGVIENYQDLIDDYLQQAADCSITDTSCSAVLLSGKAAALQSAKSAYETLTLAPREYFKAWIEDIDAGLFEWINLNQEIALATLFKPDDGRPEDLLLPEKIADYISYYLEPMTPLPDALGVLMRYLIPFGYPDFVNAFLMWGDSVYDFLLDYDLYGGVTMRKIQEFAANPGSLFDVVVLVGEGPQIFRREFQEQYLHLPGQTGLDAVNAVQSDATIQSLLQRSRSAVGEQKIRLIVSALDRAVQLERLMSAEVLDRLYLLTLNYEEIPAMRNTVAMDKLIMISREGMDSLLNDIGYRCSNSLVPTPIMLGDFMRSLDESDQGLDPQITTNVGTHSGGQFSDNRLLMGLARDPAAYRTVLQLQEGHSSSVMGYLSQNSTQCTADPPWQPCEDTELTLAATLSLPAEADITDMAFADGLLYISAGLLGMFILDIPAIISGGDAVKAQLGFRQDFYARNLLVVDEIAYVSDGQIGLISVNISDPDHPVQIADYTRMEPGVFNSYMTDTYGMVRNGNRLFVSAGYNGVLVFDINSEEIQEIDQILPTGRFIQNPVEEDFNVLDVDLLDSSTLIVTTSRYLLAFDLSTGSFSPVMLAYTELPELAYRTSLGGENAEDLVYVADGRGGIHIYNTAGLKTGQGFVKKGGIDLMGVSMDIVDTNNSTIAVAAGTSLFRVDTTSFNTLKTSCPIYGNYSRVVVQDGFLFVAGGSEIRIYILPDSSS